MKKRIFTYLLILCTALFCLGGCAEKSREGDNGPAPSPERKGVSTSNTGFFFDTVVTLRLYDARDGLMDEIMSACGRYEALLSKTVEGSDVWRINHADGQPVQVSEETWQILQSAKHFYEISDGAFSITLAPVIALWGFTDGSERMPTDEERLTALALVDDSQLKLEGDRMVSLPAGMSIDLGGIAKGYIADKIAEMSEGNVSGAVLNFGGNVYVVGLKPDGSEYRIGIRDPQGTENDSKAILTVHDTSVVTSGIYERYFIKDGVWYHHILDPKTGMPAENELMSATIVSKSSMEADAMATICIVLGAERAQEILKAQGFDAVLLTKDNQSIVTDAFPYQIHFVQ